MLLMSRLGSIGSGDVHPDWASVTASLEQSSVSDSEIGPADGSLFGRVSDRYHDISEQWGKEDAGVGQSFPAIDKDGSDPGSPVASPNAPTGLSPEDLDQINEGQDPAMSPASAEAHSSGEGDAESGGPGANGTNGNSDGGGTNGSSGGNGSNGNNGGESTNNASGGETTSGSTASQSTGSSSDASASGDESGDDEGGGGE